MDAAPRKRRLIGEINVVPLIDVMLVLLVIFMATAPLLTQGVKVDLPEASAEPVEDPDQEPVVVSVDASGNLYLNVGDDPESPIDGDTLVRNIGIVLKRQPGKSVLVRGDHAVDYGTVVSAMVLLQQAGVPHVGLVTESPEE
jgi:biopolymer transport protein TolR